MADSRWAIIKCKFSDDTSGTPPNNVYERLFTGAGLGSSNMVDFFRDMSHGQLDLSRSRVFGWFTLPFRKSDYGGNIARPGQLDRDDLFNACRLAALAGGVPLGDFFGVVATMNRGGPWPDGSDGVDLWGGGGRRAFCDRYGLQPSLMGQEMGHGYGLAHSRRLGSLVDYRDPWDSMSTMNAYTQPHPEFGQIGPGLSAASMRSRGWLDERRVWTGGATRENVTIQLRPLHRFDLPGTLAVDIPEVGPPYGRWLLEFRSKRGWDAAIPESAVLIHTLRDGISYLVPPGTGRDYLVQGDAIDYPAIPGSSEFRIEVAEINEKRETCNLRIRYSSDRRRDVADHVIGAFSGQLLGNVLVDGAGAFLRPGGGFVPVNPWDPASVVLRHAISLQSSADLVDMTARVTAQRSALRAIVDAAQSALNHLDPLGVPYLGEPNFSEGKET